MLAPRSCAERCSLHPYPHGATGQMLQEKNSHAGETPHLAELAEDDQIRSVGIRIQTICAGVFEHRIPPPWTPPSMDPLDWSSSCRHHAQDHHQRGNHTAAAAREMKREGPKGWVRKRTQPLRGGGKGVVEPAMGQTIGKLSMLYSLTQCEGSRG